MPAHLLSDSEWLTFRELLQWWRRFNRTNYNRNPALPNDATDNLTPGIYIARTPPDGIPALVQSSDTGTGTPPPSQDRDRPGFAFCYIYKILEDDNGVERLYAIGQAPIKVRNLLTAAIPGRAWITIIKENFGKYLVPAQGFEFRQCEDEITPGTGSGSGSDGDGGEEDCGEGFCGDAGVPDILTATLTNKTGCFLELPDSFELSCSNTGAGHIYESDNFSLPSCAASLNMIFILNPINMKLSINAPQWNAESGYTCSPLSAVYLITGVDAPDDGEGSCTITIIE